MSQLVLPKRRAAATPRAPKHASNGSSLGLSVEHNHDLIERVHKGLAYKALEFLSQKSGIPVLEIASILDIPERTLARRKASGRFARDESERLLRIARIYELAVDLFDGEVSGAVTWLRSRRKALGDHTPLAYSSTELGAREVENLIGQLGHGIFP